MLLDLRGFRGGVDQIDRIFAPEDFKLDKEDFRVTAPVEFKAQVTKDAQKVRLTGRVRTTLETICGRCLEAFPIPVDAPFDLMFLPASDEPETREKQVAADDVGVSFYEGDSIDLAEVMREQFFLALPMKPLCKPDCQGLCPVCGVNRNRETCDCRSDWVDPRFAVLKKLLDT